MLGKVIVAVALGVVALVLVAGVYTLWLGGEASKSWSNRLMRIRVLAQFVAIVIIVIVFYVMRRH